MKQIIAKDIAFSVIDSCETMVQCNSAKNYIYLYFNKFEDMIGLEELKRYLKEHKLIILN